MASKNYLNLDDSVYNLTNLSSKDFIHEFETGDFEEVSFFDTNQNKQVNGKVPVVAEIVLKKGETKALPKKYANEIAYHLAQIIAEERGVERGMFNVYNLDGSFNTDSVHTKIIFEILGKERVDYSGLSKDELLDLAKSKGIKDITDNMKRDAIIKKLSSV